MNEPVWYYARGDVEKGPVTGAQIKALAAAGKIRRDDFVWKEGMENWAPAGDLKELFPAERAEEPQPEADNAARPKTKSNVALRKPVSSPPRQVQPEKLVRPIGHTSLVAGLLIVLAARGCDTLAEHQVLRLQAIADASQLSFEGDWDGRRTALEQLQQSLQEKATRTPAEQQQLNEVGTELVQLETSMQSERQQLESGLWRQQRLEARQAETEHRLWGFWREAAFMLGTAILALGLLAVGFSSEGPERWIYLVMLGAIVFSVYLGGAAFTP